MEQAKVLRLRDVGSEFDVIIWRRVPSSGQNHMMETNYCELLDACPRPEE